MKSLWFLTLVVISSTCLSISFKKEDGGNYKVPSCLYSYNSDDCTGEVKGIVQADFSIKGVLAENFAIKMLEKTPGNYFRCLPNECGTHGSQTGRIDCTQWCVGIGHQNGQLAGPVQAAGLCPNGVLSGYCDCQGGDPAQVVQRVVAEPNRLRTRVGRCERIVFEFQNANNRPTGFTAEQRIWLGVDNTTGRFYSDDQCNRRAMFPPVERNTPSITLYYKDSAVGEFAGRGSVNGFVPAHLHITVEN